MRTHLWRLTSIVVLLALFISPIGSAYAAPVNAQPEPAPKAGMKVIDASYVGVSEPLSSLPTVKVEASAATTARMQQPPREMPKTQNALGTSGFDASILQNGSVANSMPAANANFEGVNNVSGVYPPDTQGDVGNDPATGKKYYVQWVNLAYQIWDVTNPAAPVAKLAAPTAGNTLWAGTGTACASSNDGDPITQFDHLANRWLMSQFALPNYPSGPFYECIAISQTADPMGAWYLYQFKTSDTLMDDYPHFGVWPDGYYMTVNQFGVDAAAGCDLLTEWCGAGVGVFERTAMLAGLPARLIYINTGAATLNYGGMLPSDLDGPAPAVGTPNYFMEWDDSTWYGDTADTLRIWEFKTDWAVPANTTFGLNANYDPNYKIATANVDPDMCGGARNCIPQPGTTQKLDAIADRLMYRLQFRDFGTYQTIVGNHTVDSTSADKAGIHWFELRNSGTGWDLGPYPTAGTYQEGVYTSGTDNIWMGSAAMDGSGDIALGYSLSSAATYPSIRYTGRLAADASGTLPQGEASLIAGTGSQTGTASRWGDYSMMAVDNADDCTFWYTQEYYATTSNVGWQTRIGSFKFPSCTTEPTGTITGTVTDTGAAPLAGATVEASGGYTTVTDAAGGYTLTMVAGTYSVTASKYGYVSSNAPAVVVVPPAATTQNFTLTAAAASTISGVVTDTTTGWPMYARLDIFGYPSSPVFTDPVTGAYSVNLINGSYTFTVSAMSGGYTPTVLPLVVSGNATQNFGLAADLVACTAPGYVVLPPAFSENFETWPLTGWTIVDNIAGGLGLIWDSNDAHLEPNNTGGAGLAATVSSDNASGDYNTELVSPVIDPTTLTNKNLVYKANYQNFNLDALDLDIKNVGDASWTNVLHWVEDHGTLNGLPGETVAVDLTTYVTGNFQLRWHYFTPEVAPWDWYAQIDAVSLGAGCAPIASGGLVVGAVKDINTNLFLNNAIVKDAALKQALFIDNSADISEHSPLYIIGEPAGAVSLTASAPLYGTDTAFPVVVAGGVVRQDFGLDAGVLSASPTALSFNVTTTAPTASKPLALNNTGGVSANYEVFAIPGTFAGYAPVGPFADHTRHFGPKNLQDLDATAIRVDLTPKNVQPLVAAGALVSSWNTGLVYGWGLGYNTEVNDLWVNDIAAGGGDDLTHRFTTAGVNTGDTIDPSPWLGTFGGDMTYNPFTNTLWQVNIGGDNCIHEMDTVTKLSTSNKICPAFGTSERGLAFDPLTNTYYAGSWNDSIINHFAPDGTIIDSASTGLSIAGLAFNPSTGHLFVSVSSPTVTGSGYYDIYVVDAKNSYTILGGFNIMNGATRVLTDGSEKGLEIDCNGNLWLQVHDATTDKVISFASGETGVCNYKAAWLSATPSTGVVGSAGTTALTASVNATGMSAGAYPAYLRVVNNTPYGDEIVPVNLTVTSPLPSPWIGGISVTSDKNIVAVGRPHIGSEIASYDGFSAGSLTAYVPMLFKNAYGGSYDSAFYIQNVDSALATLSIKYYDSTGTLTCTVSGETIAPLASKGYWLPGLAASCLPDGWVGGAVVTSDKNIVANGRPHIGAEVMTYDSFSAGSLASYLPMLFKNAYGGSYDAAFYVQNVDTTNTANLTIKYYDSAGALTCTVTGEMVAPLASKGYWLPGLAASCLPDNWVGGVKVESTTPIVTVGRPHIGTQVTTYNGFAAGAGTSYVPMLFKNAFGGSYDAAFYVQNVGATTATLSIKYYDLAGNLTCTVPDSVAPLASKGYWLPGLPATCLPDDWVGGAVVTSDVDVVAIGRPHIGAQVTTYNGFTSGSLSSSLPMLFKDAYGGSYDSAYYIQNTEASAANVITKFYDNTGALTCTRNDTLAPFSTLSLWLPGLTCLP